jgi:3-dehydroquinate dehydratase/shikimate dehydrogenase
MNNGKICVPVFAETADELIAELTRASEFADVVELRIDSLDPNEIEPFLEKFRAQFQFSGKHFLLTFRPREQGGFRDLSLQERDEFWCDGNDGFWGADYEEDVLEDSALSLAENIIASHHDFEGVPANIDGIHQRLRDSSPRDDSIIKLAAQTDDISDGLPIWKLLRNVEKGALIPIAMGEAGKWTRIMGPAFGAPLTYASLETGKENAPGQISVRDMIEVYRVKELSEQTRVYAIIGDPVSKSLSPFMHNAAFKLRGIDAVFLHMEVKDLDRFMREFIPESGLNFGGLAVTMPHKETIISYLDEIDDVAKSIGAVNTVMFENGRLLGSNTDAYGFIEPLKKAYGDLAAVKIAILGAGGAARACIYALKEEGADAVAFARNPKKAKGVSEELKIEVRDLSTFETGYFDIVINTTPIGMSVDDGSLLTSSQLTGVKKVYDLITKPAKTALIKEAKKAGVPTIGGIEMLIAQGIKQFEIWTGTDAPAEVMGEAAKQRL